VGLGDLTAMRACVGALALAASATGLQACHPMRPPVHPNGRVARMRSAVAIIEPELYSACAIYDVEMEEKMSRLKSAVADAESAAKAASAVKATMEATLNEQDERLKKMEAEIADSRAESAHLRENLQKQAASAAASAAAASSLEIEVSKLIRQLDEQGVEAAAQLKSETSSLKALLDDQSAAAGKARSDAERAEADKRELREEIDAKIIEAGEARMAAERLAADLQETQAKSADYLDAIEQIARVAATITETRTPTTSM